jgi:hypothetical protein
MDSIFTSDNAKDWAITFLKLFCPILIRCGFTLGFTPPRSLGHSPPPELIVSNPFLHGLTITE